MKISLHSSKTLASASRYGVALLSLVMLSACEKDDVQSVSVAIRQLDSTAEAQNAPEMAKNPHQASDSTGANPHQVGGSAETNPHNTGSFAVGDKNAVSWTLPAGWSELAPTSMRLGNFLYTDSKGEKVEITVASLPGAAGGIAPNIDMWRSQLNLAKAAEADVLKQTEKLKIGDMEMTLSDITSSDKLVQGKSKARIIGVIYPRGGNTWFFKMKGEESAVQSQKSAFMSFLKSLKFKD